jgi:hypothetical protein
MGPIKSLETTLEKFSKGLPSLPKNVKDWLVHWAPWLTLIGGILMLWAAWSLWHWAHVANTLINYANNLSRALGGQSVVSNRMTVGIWLGVIVLLVEAVMYLMAFPSLKTQKKSGWDLLFVVSIINVVYGVVLMFTNYGGVGNLFGSVIGTLIGWYLLFQIRSYYLGKGTTETKHAPEQ